MQLSSTLLLFVQRTMKLFALSLLFALAVIGFFVASSTASMKSPPPEVAADAIIIGDRVVDIAYHLGVLPKAMSVRGSMWPMATQLKTTTQILGCPNCIVQKKDTVPNACKKFGITRLIVEKSDPYCLYVPNVKPENIVPLMEGTGVKVEYVDFSKGLEQAVRQTAALFGREDKADDVLEAYNKTLAAAEQQLPETKIGKKVLIISGTYQASTDKCMLRIEAPGGYSDTFLLDKLGCVNVGDAFKPADGHVQKGHYPVKRTRNGSDLSPLVQAAPDVIVITGDGYSVQKTLAQAMAEHPEYKNVPALANGEVYQLPVYIDSGVLEYPQVLQKWTAALAR